MLACYFLSHPVLRPKHIGNLIALQKSSVTIEYKYYKDNVLNKTKTRLSQYQPAAHHSKSHEEVQA
jgi:hypothetical protein